MEISGQYPGRPPSRFLFSRIVYYFRVKYSQKFTMKGLLATLFFTLSVCGTYAAADDNTPLRFRRHQVDDGLSENTVFCILQDREGYMWFGTKDGLNRFDGINYKIYRNTGKPGCLGNSFVRSMALSETGELWLGTDVGVWIMDMERETFRRFDLKSEAGSRLNREVHSICIDTKGRVWMGSNEGLFLYEPDSDRTVRFLPGNGPHTIPSSVVWKVFQDRGGSVWAGTREGLVKYDEATGTFTPVLDPQAKMVGDDEILSICEDANGFLWLGTWSGGLKKLDRGTRTFTSRFGHGSGNEISHIRTIFDFSSDHLLVGSDDGLYRVNKADWNVRRIDRADFVSGLSDKNVYSIYKDREDGIWIGTYFGGVNYLVRNNIDIYTRDPAGRALTGRAVSQFCEDAAGNLWIATEDGGLNYFNTRTNSFENHRVPHGISYHNLHALMLEENRLWIGTFSRGIDVCRLPGGPIRNYRHSDRDSSSVSDNCIFSIYRNPAGEIYVGTAVGLDRYDRKRDRFQRMLRVTTYVIDIREDTRGNLWVATCGSGLYRYDRKKGTWHHYLHEEGNEHSLAHNKATGLYIDSRDRLWVSTEGGGISVYDYAQDCFTTYSDRDGLANNVVYGILEDASGNLWFSTNRGINRFNPEDSTALLHYTQMDGLQSNEFNYRSSYRARDGKFYFGGINGFNAFRPDDLPFNETEPPVKIHSIRFLNDSDQTFEENIRRQLRTGTRITLPHNRSSFTVSFVALSYKAPARNEYAYMLEGADETWSYPTDHKSVTYVNLAPGDYTFRVKASNNNGVWNETGDSLQIEILPPFWQSGWAKLLYAALLAWIVFVIIRYYKYKYKKRSRVKMEEFRVIEERKSMESKLSFFTSIAHEIRTPVSLIKAPLEAVLSSGEGSEETRENLQIIERNSERLAELINQLLDFRKLDTDHYKLRYQAVSLYDFLKELIAEFDTLAREREVSLIFEADPEARTTIISDRDALTKICTNLLSNAMKFAAGNITVRLKRTEGEAYTVTVADDGPGIPDAIKERVFEPFFQSDSNSGQGTGIGLSLARLMAEKLGGELTLGDNRPHGSLFTFTFRSLEKPQVRPADITEEKEETASDKPTILFVDDNEEIRRFIHNNFRPQYHLLTADGAESALKIMESHSVDLLILDIMMPGTDGLTLARSIRENPDYCHIPIILLSAKTGIETKVEGLESGADVFIEKPFSPAHLRAQIDSLLASRNRMYEAFSHTPVSLCGNLVKNNKDRDMLSRVNAEIEKHISDPEYNVDMLSEELGFSRSNLQRKLKGVCGMTPNDYLRTYRLKRAAELLSEGIYRVNEVCYLVGFNSPSYFAKCFAKQFGVLPKEYNKEQ